MAITHLQKPAKFLADVWKQYNITKEGGFQGKEVFDFIPALLQLPDIFSSSKEIAAEWKARTAADIDALLAYVITSVEWPNEKAKEQATAVAQVIAGGLKLQLAFKQVSVLPTPNPIP